MDEHADGREQGQGQGQGQGRERHHITAATN